MIFASICLYLLIGLLWAFIHQLIEVSHPGAFKFASADVAQIQDARVMRGHFSYYSYVTLSTLGYGDITPVTRVARSWAVLETIIGQFYLALVIARLMGLYISKKFKRKGVVFIITIEIDVQEQFLKSFSCNVEFRGTIVHNGPFPVA